MCLFIYAHGAFPNIPREWGGGEKPVIDLFLTERLAVFVNTF